MSVLKLSRWLVPVSLAALAALVALIALTRGTHEHAAVLPRAPDFVGPSYYAKFKNGPSSSMSYFPIYTYQVNLTQWSQLPSRISEMGVNGVDNAYDGASQADIDRAAQSGMHVNIAGPDDFSSQGQIVTSYAMQDEPNTEGDKYAMTSCPHSPPPNDPCAKAYVHDANAYRSADRTRPVWGNFGKEIEEWNEYPPSGWTTAQFEQHLRTEIRSLDIVSADYYAWTDPYEMTDSQAGDTTCKTGYLTHCGAWVYGHTQDRLRYYAPNIPTYGFIECCGGGGGSGPENQMTPGMIQSSAWNILVHGGRGIVWWTTDFVDSSPGGDPRDKPYSGATYYGDYALYGDHQWDPQYDAARDVDQQIEASAPELNSPTVDGISASGQNGVPVTTLGKDYHGKLWLLVQADGDAAHQLSNTATMTATVTLPAAVPAGTVLTVVGENRTVTVNSRHQIADTFATTTETPTYDGGVPITYGYQHHIYRER